MSTLQIPVRAVHKYVQNVRVVFLRQKTGGSVNATLSNPTKHDQQSDNNNSCIRPVFYNRNPRNLELLTISTKPEGYHLDRFNVQFWHKLVVSGNQSKVSADVVHNNGTTVVSASSNEFGIRRFLYRAADVSAYKTVGKVIAQRCLESGINSVYCDIKAEEDTKLAYLLEEAQNSGLSLEETETYKNPFVHTRGVPTKPWDIIS